MIQEIESLGYASLWFGEAPGGRDPFSRAAMLLAATDRVVVGTGIASIWMRSPAAMVAAAETLAEACPGRFVLGLGVSHRPLVTGLGFNWSRPLTRMRGYLSEMDGVDLGFERAGPRVRRVIAALRPRMLELARSNADGAHTYLVPVEHTRRARAILGSDKLLLPELAVVLADDAAVARDTARTHVGSFYLEAENYTENLRWLGWEESDLAGGGSDALVDALVAAGSEDAVRERVVAHLDAGADQVLVQPLAGSHPEGQLTLLRRLAPVLDGV